MAKNRHQGTELEFAAKRINDLLKKTLPDRHLGFMTFVFDYGEGGYLGYLSSTERMDAFRVISEWLEKTIDGFSREDLIEILERYKAELSSDGTATP